MNKLFKAVICLIVLFLFTEAKAQFSLGGGVWYGTDIDNVGFSVNGKYEFNDKWAVAPTYSYFLKKEIMNWSTLDIDANYQFTGVGDKGSLYGIGGLNLTFWKLEYSGNIITDLEIKSTAYCFNLGLGLHFDISDKFSIAPELKSTFGDINYFRMGIIIMYGF